MNIDRQLAVVSTISSLSPIPDADAIERARIRGWDVVVRKGEFEAGDRCLYVEIDSLIDVEDPRFAFLAPRGVRTDAEGRRGHVLKTAKLRGQYSQGLALPLDQFPELDGIDDGADATDAVGIVKWEAPVPASLSGQVRGMRPAFIVGTDEERIQNLPPQIFEARDHAWIPTEKIDGSSASFGLDDQGDFHVCSRNLDLLEDESNTFWRLARQLDVESTLRADFDGQPLVVQGEAFGEGIQGNPLKMRGHHFRAFNLLINRRSVPRQEWPSWILDMSVPVLDFPFPVDLDEALGQVERLKSAITPQSAAEGIVWRAGDVEHVQLPDGSYVRASFKVISRRYLLRADR